MKITDIKTKETCKGCGANIFKNTWAIQTNVGLFCNDCQKIAMLYQDNWRMRNYFKNLQKLPPALIK